MNKAASDQSFEGLLNYLKRSHGFDLSKYKCPNLIRQIKKRMVKVKTASYEEYLDYLNINAIELTDLFDTVLLNVTSFFRDTPAWQYLALKIIPQIIASKLENEPIRVWSAGCASGEEAYTISIILAESLGVKEFKKRVRIYATDLDQAALDHGRKATYTPLAVRDVPPELLAKYFDPISAYYTFSRELRPSIIFGCQDLV